MNDVPKTHNGVPVSTFLSVALTTAVDFFKHIIYNNIQTLYASCECLELFNELLEQILKVLFKNLNE